MKIKHCGKYIGYVAVISFITLLAINLTNSKNIEGKSRIIIKSTEKVYVPNIKENTGYGGIRVITNGSLDVQILPTPDANLPIIISPLDM